MTASFQDQNSASGRAVAIRKVPTGIRGFDSILMGGLPAGRTTLLSGGPGTGKTVFGLEFLHRGAEAGEPGIFVTFEERAEAVRDNARALGLGVEALEEAGQFVIVDADVPPELVLSGEFSIDGLLAILAGQAEAMGARRIVVDAVDVLIRIFQEPMRQQNQFQVLHNWLHDQGLTAVVTAKAVPDQLDQHPFLDFMADCVIRMDQRVVGQINTRRLRVLKYRGSGFLDNEYPYVIEADGLVLMPVSTADLSHQPLGERISAGGDELDAILGGGFRRASSVLLAGGSGTGKTTLACTFALAACQRSERALYISFEESQEALVSSLLSPGLDMRPALASGRLKILTAMPESMGVEHHLLRIFHAIDQFEPDHVIVDAISACSRMGSDQGAFDFLVRVVTWCKSRGITFVCTNQIARVSNPDEISGFGISSLVDTLVLLEQIHAPAYERRILVIKSRGSIHSHDYHSFAITDRGVSFALPQREGAGPGGAADADARGGER
ncbi:MAG: circadian clock protein KaiC [Phycisphaeraceae bacterium]